MEQQHLGRLGLILDPMSILLCYIDALFNNRGVCNSLAGGGSLFFMLAQAVDDPWDELSLVPGCPARDWVWATRQEVASQLLDNKPLSELAEQMLSN